MITDPIFYFVAIPAVLIVGISKGGFGGGLGLVAVPLMALVISPTQAAAIMLPILCTMDLFAMWSFRGTYDKANLKIMIPAAIVGIAIGALTFHWFSEDHIKLLIGLLTFAFCLQWVVQAITKQDMKEKPATAVRGNFWSAVAGFTSFSVHAGGPPVSFFLLPQKMDKTLFVGTTVIFFTVVNYVKLIPYGILGLLPVGNLTTSLMLLPLAPFGVRLGLYLHNKVNAVLFYRFCYAFLFLAGIKLTWEGVSGLL